MFTHRSQPIGATGRGASGRDSTRGGVGDSELLKEDFKVSRAWGRPLEFHCRFSAGGRSGSLGGSEGRSAEVRSPDWQCIRYGTRKGSLIISGHQVRGMAEEVPPEWKTLRGCGSFHQPTGLHHWTAHQAPPSMGYSRQEYWSGLPFPSPGDLPDLGIEPRSPSLQADALTSEPPGKPSKMVGGTKSHLESNPKPTRDTQRAQTNLGYTKTQRTHRD